VIVVYVIIKNGTGFVGYNSISVSKATTGTSPATVTITSQYQPGKTLWDWLQLLIIPLALAVIALWFNRLERKNEQALTSENQQEAVLQSYFDHMSEFLIKKSYENLS